MGRILNDQLWSFKYFGSVVILDGNKRIKRKIALRELTHAIIKTLLVANKMSITVRIMFIKTLLLCVLFCTAHKTNFTGEGNPASAIAA